MIRLVDLDVRVDNVPVTIHINGRVEAHVSIILQLLLLVNRAQITISP